MSEEEHEESNSYKQEITEHVEELEEAIPREQKREIRNKKSGLAIIYNKMSTYKVYLDKKLNDDGDLLNVQVKIPGTYPVVELIKYCLQLFNKKLEDEGHQFQLVTEESQWSLCEAKKKNGKPKDEPNFANDISIQDLGSPIFALLINPNYTKEENYVYYNSNGSGQEQQSEQEFVEQQQGQNFNLETFKKFKCRIEECGKAFMDSASLKKHMMTHEDKTYICPIEGCNKKFVDNSKLRRHQLVHKGERPYKCHICSKIFSLDFNLKTHLKTHLRTHTGEKPYQCRFPGCGKRFTQSSNLSAHEKSHSIKKEQFQIMQQQQQKIGDVQ